ncbi:sodium-dependent nutrient amino acid transporter 1 [Ixodes scapularis]|nr:sodium-dependent nutrient amino acid transporter 1 [Ixodes scapularis]
MRKNRQEWELEDVRRLSQDKGEKKDTTLSLNPEGTKDEGQTDDSRTQWGQGLQFFLSCLSISIGLGNVWRFPTLAYQNGGGAFLIPYFVVLFLIGKPMYFLELAIGQFVGKSPLKIWKCVPGFRGIGIAQIFSTFYTLVSYNYIMALCLFYMFASMQSVLPWTYCDTEWSDETCYDNDLENSTMEYTANVTSSAEQYFQKYVLKNSGGFTLPSALDWRMALCLLLAWVCEALSTIKGVDSIGKVVYVTSTFPYVVLVSLLVITCLQDGAFTGIKAFFVPQWEKILDIEVWFKACEQSFFSLGIGFGYLVMYSSFNDFKHNVGRDAFLISIADTITSVLAGCVVFGTLGSLAHELGTDDISQVLKGESDLGLAFVTYPEALSRISFIPQFWSVMFFIMLFMLGLGSGVGGVQLVTTVLTDQYPGWSKWKSHISILFCVISFGTGLVLCTDSGNAIRLLFDNYGVGRALFIYGTLQVVGFVWIYGFRNIIEDFEYMLNKKVSWYWKITWGFITPVSLISIFIYGTATEGGSSSLPPIGQTIGWIMAGIAVGQIVLWMTITFINAKGSDILEKLKTTFSPTPSYGPRDPKVFKEWKEWKFNKRNNASVTLPYNISGQVNPSYQRDEDY